MSSNRNIIDLISKLNDRNLQKRRESGMTVYVLMTVLSYLLIKIIEITPKLITEYSPVELAEFSLGVCSIYFGGICIVTTNQLTNGHESPVKLIKKEFDKSLMLGSINAFLFPLIPMFLGAASILQNQNWFLYSMLGLFGVMTALMIWVVKGNKKKRQYELVQVYNSGKPKRIKDTGVLILLFCSIMFIFLPIIHFSTQQFSFRTESFSDLIKVSLFIYSVPLVIDYILEMIQIKYKDNLLEELEKEIYINDLSNEEIHKKLKERYVGLGFNNWLDNQIAVLRAFFVSLDQELEEIKSFKIKTLSIDYKKYPREVKGRIVEFENKLKSIDERLTNKIRKMNIDINNIKDEVGEQLSRNEIDEIKDFTKLGQGMINRIQTIIKELKND